MRSHSGIVFLLPGILGLVSCSVYDLSSLASVDGGPMSGSTGASGTTSSTSTGSAGASTATGAGGETNGSTTSASATGGAGGLGGSSGAGGATSGSGGEAGAAGATATGSGGAGGAGGNAGSGGSIGSGGTGGSNAGGSAGGGGSGRGGASGSGGSAGGGAGGAKPYTGTAYLGVVPNLGAVASTLYGVEGEKYDVGGEGVAFHDTTPTNTLGAYRTSSGESVDIEANCGNNCLDIADIAPGEWTKYSVNVVTGGTYKVQLGAASATPRNMHIEVDGVNVTGALVVNTGGAATFRAIDQSVTFTMTAGRHIVTFAFDDGFMALNWVNFQRL